QNHLGNLNGHVEEMYKGHQVVKAFGQEKQGLDHFNQMNDDLYEAGRKAQFISGIIMPVMMFIGNLSYVLISIIGGILVTNRVIARWNMQALIMYRRRVD